MKLVLILLGLPALLLGYYSATTYAKFRVSQALVKKAVPFENLSSDQSVSLLVLGDSTAVGVGASEPEDTVAGRYAESVGATYVENQAVSGAKTNDLFEQISQARLESYDYILIQIGANDIIRFRSAEEAGGILREVLRKLPPHQNLKLLSAGNVGATEFFPWFLNPLYTKLNLKYHEVFASVVAEAGGVYVNLYQPPEDDPFTQNSDKYLAPDGLHLSSDGYALWAEKVIGSDF